MPFPGTSSAPPMRRLSAKLRRARENSASGQGGRMKSQPVPERPRFPRLACVAKVSAFAVLVWASLGGGVVMLLEGNTVGIGLIILGFAVISGFRARAIPPLH